MTHVVALSAEAEATAEDHALAEALADALVESSRQEESPSPTVI